MIRSIKLAFALLIFSTSFGQDKWDIRRCVDHALKNNISVRQTDLQSRFSELSYKQNKGGQLPSLNFGSSVGYRLGRSDNPTTGVLEDNNFLNVGMQLQSSVSLFNWFSQKNTIEASRLSWEADKEQTKKIQNDIALNVAVAYLQILLAREQANLSNVQVDQTKAQLENTRKRVDAGVLPELNAAELEAQLARDSSSLVTAEASVQQFLLQMKALLNLDAGASFDIVTPPVSLIPLEALADLQPDAVYGIAISTLPQQKVNELRIQSAKKTVAAAKAGLYPTISAFGSLSTNAISFKKAIYDQVLNGYSPSGARANAGGGTFYPIEIPNYVDGSNVVGYYKPGSITRQFNSNFGQSIGIGLNVPIFNGRIARTAWDRSKLTVQQFELQKEQGDMQLKQDIYKAYTDATAALQKFNADKKSVQAAEKAYDFASKRYELNLLSTYDLIISQNNVQRTRIQALYSQYDYVFKMKLLEFYKGQGIKL
ncbi:MAG TPA: TolC family protein [Chitinophagaceae bacterium]|nr:TolC family protein [Chitinophagaceae bacterium]